MNGGDLPSQTRDAIWGRMMAPVQDFTARLKTGGFFANVAKLFAGNISSQAIVFIATPVITRLFSPEDFGVMAFVASVTSVFSVLAGLRYERSIMLPKYDIEAAHLVVLTTAITCIITLWSGLLIAIFSDPVARLFGTPELKTWLWLVPLGVFLSGIKEAFTYWYSRKKAFGVLAWRQFHTAFWTVAAKMAAGMTIGASALWLILGNLLGVFNAVLYLLAHQFRNRAYSPFIRIRKKGVIALARRYKAFPLYASWTALLNAVSQNLLVFLLTFYFSPVAVGFLALARSMMRRPVDIVSESLSKVLLEKIARSNSSGESLTGIFVKATLGLALVGAPPFILLVLFGPALFTFIFGQAWEPAGQYARLLSPWLFFAFIMTPANQVITVRERLRFDLMFHLLITISRAAAFIAGYWLYREPEASIILFSLVSMTFLAFYIGYGYRLTIEENAQVN